MLPLLVRRAQIADGEPAVDIAIADGRIARISPAAPAGTPGAAQRVIDAAGCVVLPGLIESHIHLDKALLERRRPNRSGTLREALEGTAELKRAFTYDDIYARATQVLRWALSRGVTHLRCHTEIDPIVGLLGFRALCDVRKAFQGRVDLQIVAFPQEGIFRAPGTERLLRTALESGADLLGGVPYNDRDPGEHIERLFGLAREYDVDLDLHVDFSDNPADRTIATIADLAIAHRYEGRVAVGHLTSLGAMAPQEAGVLIERIRAAGIHVITLPATDLYLNGRGGEGPVPRGLTPVRRLLDAGVNVCLSSNNVRNAFTPLGRADPLEIALLLAYAGHMGTPSDRLRLLAMVTVNPARALGLAERYGLQVGRDADLVVLRSTRLDEVVADQPERLWVIKRGRVVVETTSTVWLDEPARPASAGGGSG
jgi:cytosine deaminase